MVRNVLESSKISENDRLNNNKTLNYVLSYYCSVYDRYSQTLVGGIYVYSVGHCRLSSFFAFDLAPF